ncbi:glycosyltransferase family 4 protein [Candidatus Uhrbacteria bacterium]|nr:glycosyltransferase family 4 protein [Candidatus Uhrbacteria bacterium]
MDKKRVLIFATTYYPVYSGAEVAVHELTDRIDDFEYDLICARFKSGLSRSERIGNVMVHRVGLGRPLDKYLLPVLGPLRALRLKKPDIVWSLMASYGGFAALFFSWLKPKPRLLLTLQEGDPLEHYTKRLGIFSPLHPLLFARADAVQAISHFLADWSKRMGFSGEPEVIPNGVPIEQFTKRILPEERARIRSGFGFSESDTVLIHTGRLSKKNGVDDLIRSLLILPSSFKILLIGNGEDENALKNLAEQLDVSKRIVFAGPRPYIELPPYLQASDIFVRASLSEGLGNSFLEAMACGIPVIGTPVGGIPDFLTDGETGIMCHPRDPKSIAEAVLRLIGDRDLRDRLVQNGSRLVADKYNWDRLADAFGKLLAKLVVMKRILVATGAYPPKIGGSAIISKEMTDDFRKNGHHVDVLTYGERVRYVPFAWKARRLLKRMDQAMAFDAYSSGIPVRLALIGLSVEFVIRLGGEWIWESSVLKGKTKKPLRIFWKEQIFSFSDRLKLVLYRWVLTRTDRVIVPSAFIGDILPTIEPSVAGKISIVPNERRFESIAQRPPRAPGPLRLIFVGRYVPVKNLPFLADILKELHQEGLVFSMTFIGDGPDENRLKEILKGIEGIRFAGRLPHDEAMREISKADLMLHPSLSDISPNTVVETISLGVPCLITTEHGLTRPLHGCTEIPPDDRDGWKQAIKQFKV